MKRKNGKRRQRVSILNWLFGYYEVSLPLGSCEDFLNLCMRYGFEYYSLKLRKDENQVTLYLRATEYKRVKTACRLWQIRMKTLSLNGLPPHVLKYRKRWGILAGACLSLALLIVAQGVVWRIDVIGNERLSKERIIEALSQNGLNVGDWKASVKTDSVEQGVMINDDEVAWISINMLGTVAKVEVREVIDTDIVEKNTKPANVVALYDAEIVSVEAYSGFVCVKEGDYVRAGELLVSGIYKTEKAPIRYSHASARIMARVSRTFVIEIPQKQVQKVYSNEKITKKTLNFFDKSIKLFTNYRNLPTSCDIMNYVYILDPFSLGELPISISVDEYRPYETREVMISEDEAIEQGYELLRRKIDEELPEAQILKKDIYGEFVDGKYVLRCDLTAVCNISKQIEFEVLP